MEGTNNSISEKDKYLLENSKINRNENIKAINDSNKTETKKENNEYII